MAPTPKEKVGPRDGAVRPDITDCEAGVDKMVRETRVASSSNTVSGAAPEGADATAPKGGNAAKRSSPMESKGSAREERGCRPGADIIVRATRASR